MDKDDGARRLAELLLRGAGSPTPEPPMPPRSRTRQVDRVLGAFTSARRPVILLHDNPDPDAIGSGLALAKLLQARLDLCPPLVYGGVIARAENRALVEELDIELHKVADFAWSDADAIALLDCQPSSGNHSLPAGLAPAVVLDHHPLIGKPHADTLTDIRPDYGATCTILTEYLEDAQVHVDERIATALFYGIKTDTQDLGRQASGIDALAYLRLFVAADKRALARIQNPCLPRMYFRAMHDALERVTIYGDAAVARLEDMVMPETTGETADLIVRLDDMHWSMAIGRYDGRLLFSLRATAAGSDVGAVAEHLAGRHGFAGGHWRLAGGSISVRDLEPPAIDALEDQLIVSFLDAIRAPTEGRALLDVGGALAR
ncbi:MAG TPA: DHH family phosphoesterase [Chloroflexota bacterium]|nr:DHH family phosphoesterase [Chloroflexota bacterium]